MMNTYLINLNEVDQSTLPLAGGKAANLGDLTRIEGIKVPDGFCLSIRAYRHAVENNKRLSGLLKRLEDLSPTNRNELSGICHSIRTAIEQLPVPDAVAQQISDRIAGFDANKRFAIRSSATAEDLSGTSFAGQYDSFLNISGLPAILDHIRKCWASLFTERAVIYRMQNGIGHRQVSQAVIVQQMIDPKAAGVLFTADPLTGNRRVTSINAVIGLAEALVEGKRNADSYQVRDGRIADKKTAPNKMPDGQHAEPVLGDAEILELEKWGRKIEKHFGAPQDIEWCLSDGTFYFVQSRPITTLFPVPETQDREKHVFISVGHQQMMTAALKPLGISFWQLTAARHMFTGGGRLFVDIIDHLRSPEQQRTVIETLGQSDPLIKDALLQLVERNDFLELDTDESASEDPGRPKKPISSSGFRHQIENDPAIVSQLISEQQASIDALRNEIQSRSGTDLFDFILADLQERKNSLFHSRNLNLILAAMDAAQWLNENLGNWLGEKNAAGILSQSVPHNITSQMGLDLLDVADAIRPFPEVVQFLQNTKNDNFLSELDKIPGGAAARSAIGSYLDKYRMRCTGEIDITRPRWSERPLTLVPLILSNLQNHAPGASRRQFDQGLREARDKEREIVARLKQLPDGDQKAAETQAMISLLRNFSGYREYPKYSMVNRYFIYRQALLEESGKLVAAGIIRDAEDVYFLTFEEFRDLVQYGKADYDTINRRREAFRQFEKLSPPRVITSDGEIISGRYKRENLPPGSLIGLPVSAGIVEGRARVILNMEEADLEEGDILITPFTDPGWTALFLSIKGLVTEVGGLMTHGAVIAREYGLPAVVGVEDATKHIRDGQMIRLNGTEGFVEMI